MANSNRRNGRSESQAVGAPKWVVFVGGLATGVIATVVTGALLWPRTLAPATDADRATATTSEQAKPNDTIHYEYDDMLRTSEVPVDAPENADAAKPVDSAPARVVLQAGSFRNRDDAEYMRAQLLMLGIGPTSTREALVKGGEVWHRVLVGPFANETALHAAQGKLQRQNIEALSIAAPADMRVEAPVDPDVARPALTRAEGAYSKADDAPAPARAPAAAITSSGQNGAAAAKPTSQQKPLPRPAQPATAAPIREQPLREQPARSLPVEAASAENLIYRSAINRIADNTTRERVAGATQAISLPPPMVAVIGAA